MGFFRKTSQAVNSRSRIHRSRYGQESVALLLSAIGLFGVISYSVVQRRLEIGIRSALGASPNSILGLILRSGLTLTCIGLLVGLIGTMFVTRLLSAMLYGVGRYDPVTMAVVATLLIIVAVVACLVPSMRALRVNPIAVLRGE